MVHGVPATKIGDDVYEVTLPAGVKVADLKAYEFSAKTIQKNAVIVTPKMTNTEISNKKFSFIIKVEDGTMVSYTVKVNEAN